MGLPAWHVLALWFPNCDVWGIQLCHWWCLDFFNAWLTTASFRYAYRNVHTIHKLMYSLILCWQLYSPYCNRLLFACRGVVVCSRLPNKWLGWLYTYIIFLNLNIPVSCTALNILTHLRRWCPIDQWSTSIEKESYQGSYLSSSHRTRPPELVVLRRVFTDRRTTRSSRRTHSSAR